MRCLRILRIEKLNSITFCIAPPADTGGVFVRWSIRRRALFRSLFRLRKPTKCDKIKAEKIQKRD